MARPISVGADAQDSNALNGIEQRRDALIRLESHWINPATLEAAFQKMPQPLLSRHPLR
jgi:hypothetical protein